MIRAVIGLDNGTAPGIVVVELKTVSFALCWHQIQDAAVWPTPRRITLALPLHAFATVVAIRGSLARRWWRWRRRRRRRRWRWSGLD